MIWQSRAMISNSGLVTMRQKRTASFKCELEDRPLPFATHRCSINIAMLVDQKIANLTGEYSGMIQGNTFKRADSLGVSNSATDMGLESEIHFNFEATSDAGPMMSSLFFFQFALNMIAFAQFWMPESADRTGITMTTILAAAVLQSEAGVGGTWMGRFLSASLFFQLFCFILSLTQLHHTDAAESHANLARKRNFMAARSLAHIISATLRGFATLFLGKAGLHTYEDLIGRRVVVP
eukprot:CAMPEP_0172838804 /NCGR_PEP_ID=MMETSP1075-20121228/28128_1 /TAXON_ID=2916 /ORGANISM="Ceratium fusus, Strain PA161109" /LENGTH=236 /DNA_ID=CAMNT_0013682369 /DNA_START=54 /DNA_END=761 /DNA_ORIENTATION=+